VIDGYPLVIEEVPERAELILRAIQEAKLGPVHAPIDHGIEPVLAVHDVGFITYLQTIFARGTAVHGRKTAILPGTIAPRNIRRSSTSFYGLIGYYCFGTDSPILEGTWQAAYWSAQCALSGADQIKAGDRAVYALCRPPGHHAAAELYGGFCYLNNAAIAARNLGGRTAILDIDFHHGNGTQEIFYTDPTVFFCSLHAHPMRIIHTIGELPERPVKGRDSG
jgi:acetoin utilization deacetylase AcuC-like enzyme